MENKLIKKARSHPENFCHQCGGKNVTWHVDSKFWNMVCERWEIICPKCFQERMDEIGISIIFKGEIII